ncbi:MAG: ribokinase [Firmicutes bacterium]|nr:ribokinase [Bacillota bacterium]
MDLVATVETLPRQGETVIGTSFRQMPGGKGANQAVAAAKMGATVTMVGRIGADTFGDTLLTNLAANRVETARVLRDDRHPTGVALITVDRLGHNTIVVCPGANAVCSPDDIDSADSAIAQVDAVIAQLEIPVATVSRALSLARAHGKLTVLNPAPVADPASVKALFQHVDIIIPNELEAEALTGVPVAHEAAGSGAATAVDGSEAAATAAALEAARQLRALGAKRVIITLGERGAVFVGPEGEIVTTAFRVQAVDTTAAGDAFVATFTVAWIEGMPPKECMRWACAAGAIATTKPGAQPSLPARQEVEALLSAPSYVT